MNDAAAHTGALVCAAAGLIATYLRLRCDFDRVDALLSAAVLAGATPLLHAVVDATLSDTALFALLAVVSWATAARVRPPLIQTGVLLTAVAVVPVIAPSAEARPTLFAANNGFLALTPFVYIATMGLLAHARKQLPDVMCVLLGFALWPITNTSLVPLLALLAVGFADVMVFARRRPVVAAAPLVLGAILWNYWLMVQYTVGTIPKDAPVSFAAMVRQ